MKKLNKFALFGAIALLAVGCGGNTVDHGEPIAAEEGKAKFQAVKTEVASEEFVAPDRISLEVKYLENEEVDGEKIKSEKTSKVMLAPNYFYMLAESKENNSVQSYAEFWYYLDGSELYSVANVLDEGEYIKQYRVSDLMTEELAKATMNENLPEISPIENVTAGVIDCANNFMTAIDMIHTRVDDPEEYLTLNGYSSESKLEVSYSSKNDKHVYCSSTIDLIAYEEDNETFKERTKMFIEAEIENNLPSMLYAKNSELDKDGKETYSYITDLKIKYNFKTSTPNLDDYELNTSIA